MVAEFESVLLVRNEIPRIFYGSPRITFLQADPAVLNVTRLGVFT